MVYTSYFFGCFGCFIFFPQAVHFVFSKNCSSPQRRFPHLTRSAAPQLSQLSAPIKVG
jgi:hypothetical protein